MRQKRYPGTKTGKPSLLSRTDYQLKNRWHLPFPLAHIWRSQAARLHQENQVRFLNRESQAAVLHQERQVRFLNRESETALHESKNQPSFLGMENQAVAPCQKNQVQFLDQENQAAVLFLQQIQLQKRIRRFPIQQLKQDLLVNPH
jgi:hypothetical protein